MIRISREEIMELFERWNIDALEQLEEVLERQLTDEELKRMILHVIGYYDFADNQTLGELVNNIGLEDMLTSEEFERIRDVEME